MLVSLAGFVVYSELLQNILAIRCKQQNPPTTLKGFNLSLRRGRDSNPRYRFQYDSLANCSFRPLRHLSGFRQCKHNAKFSLFKVDLAKNSHFILLYQQPFEYQFVFLIIFLLAQIIIDANMVNALQHRLEYLRRFGDLTHRNIRILELSLHQFMVNNLVH